MHCRESTAEPLVSCCGEASVRARAPALQRPRSPDEARSQAEALPLTDADTIAAIVTPVVPQGSGVAIVRISGDDAVPIARKRFRPGRPAARDTQLSTSSWVAECHRVHYGCVYDDDSRLVDEVRTVTSSTPRECTDTRAGAAAANAQAALVHTGRRGGAPLPWRQRVRAARALAMPGACALRCSCDIGLSSHSPVNCSELERALRRLASSPCAPS